jgi:hypothetical protein
MIRARRLSGSTRVDLSEHELLELVVEGQDTSSGDTSENVGSGTLEERLDTLLGDDLGSSVDHGLVVDGSTGSHHHSSSDSVEGVRSETGTGGDSPTEKEGGKEVTLKRTNKDDGLNGVVETEVEASVDNDTNNGRDETSVETGNTVRGEGLSVDVDETVELSGSTLGGRLVVVGKTGSGVVERVDEEEGRGTGSSTGSNVSGEPLPVALVLLETEQRLEVVLEGEVKSLGGEVSDDIGGVTSPQRDKTLIGVGSGETVTDTLVRVGETTLLDPDRVSR